MAVGLCNNCVPTVAIIKIGPAVEQKLHIAVAVSESALLSAMTFAPTGYPHSKLVSSALSQRTPNSIFVIDFLLLVCSFSVNVVSTIKGNSAGNTLKAHIVTPFTKLCMYLAGADIKIKNIAANSIIDVIRIYFTLQVYLY